MSRSSRIEHREQYIRGWYQMDAELILAATSSDFIFDDPAEPEPVDRNMLADYMQRWDRRARAAGGNNQWVLTHVTRTDKDGILTDWEWWEVIDTDLQGTAIVLTNDDGVFLERITYFDRTMRHPGMSR